MSSRSYSKPQLIIINSEIQFFKSNENHMVTSISQSKNGSLGYCMTEKVKRNGPLTTEEI